MTQILETTRAFRVHARHVDIHHARILQEPSFEAAAVAYVEHLHVMPDDGEDISVVVREIESGHEHHFRIAMGTEGTASER